MPLFVKCIDNTLVRDELTVGRLYEVWIANHRDGNYHLTGFERPFSITRFVEAGPADLKAAGRCSNCSAPLGRHGKCPALCEPVENPEPYRGPTKVGRTHMARLAAPVA
ncbi:hypothetical protein HAP48_0042600 [Bradyrhizobium septentrionale]|uniref:Uncharacterized protein n=1 Tax=Bradyrhizobium septentrionale TaxID=1404411 RepID=A0A973W2L8_9BRAD|nr:hypothetical protein [Bradyrhizobium septentrionale]UGY15150.1 hypothetical protein HAP48_0042600 [Bradyrhizobium septentrionale]